VVTSISAASGGARGGGKGEELLVRAVEDGDGSGLCFVERPWRLNFDGFRRPEAPLEKPGQGLQDCLGMLCLSCLSDTPLSEISSFN
jgi:hypothetical protein